jgi:hypothetical protein
MTAATRIALHACAVVLVLASRAGAAEPDSNVLDAGFALPKAFTSLRASGQPNTGKQRIDAIYDEGVDGFSVWFTTERAGAQENAEAASVDVCIRDLRTSESLLVPQTVGEKSSIDGCLPPRKVQTDMDRKLPVILRALGALESVRFKAIFEPERRALLGQAAAARSALKQAKAPVAQGGTVP